MALLVAIQESIDITFHIVTDEGWGSPQSYAEGFSMLSEKKILPEALATELSQAVGLRNRLAHGYAAVDVERLWTELPRGLASLRSFAQSVAQFASS